jgi:hypothetical protein
VILIFTVNWIDSPTDIFHISLLLLKDKNFAKSNLPGIIVSVGVGGTFISFPSNELPWVVEDEVYKSGK